MINIDDDDDGLLFDEPDESEAGYEPTNCLVVSARPPSPEILNALEAQYRRQGLPPVVFEEDDENGRHIAPSTRFA